LREDFVDDFDTDEMFLNDFINRITQFNINCDAIVLLRPTSPIRDEGLIDQCIQEFEKNWQYYDSLRTVSISNKTPYKMWFALHGPNSTKFGEPICKMIGGVGDAHSMPRQILREAYVQNGLVDIIKVDVLRRLKSSSGSRVLLYETKDKWVDIDNMSDLET
jgi:CMP-N-acetylneuraminic acid synthetase